MHITRHRLAKNTKYETPYYIVRGDLQGNTVMVTAGVHGSERGSIYGANQLLNQLQMRTLFIKRGVLIIVPIVNQQAYKTRSRGKPDLNRTFPRAHNRTARHPLSAALFQLAKQFQPSWYLDLHEADGLFKLNPRSLGQTLITNPKSEAIPAVRRVVGHMNRSITLEKRKFSTRLHQLPGSGRTAVHLYLKAKAVTVETSIGLPIADRVKYQVKILNQFLNELKIK
ncbi:succinylglutamate desuccinylase/aspartoacylase family protein [Bacillus sp. FJAT-26390]|uniref:succinylglutamate desuccinylase/aspartoacylase domain-containing protein n=1 Tax=Bacillus sp. FJAT-26390 TaxID=1743142 RepID=UPI00080808A7|nr:succinylglutamate desuccinylase/aspartoacylase family protein [Bacillus sp. FJAT-26390]OBZ17077.1 deacylase [Bacillus sp. FJAT-26390]